MPVLLEKVEEICVNVTGLEITLWASAERPIGCQASAIRARVVYNAPLGTQ